MTMFTTVGRRELVDVQRLAGAGEEAANLLSPACPVIGFP